MRAAGFHLMSNRQVIGIGGNPTLPGLTGRGAGGRLEDTRNVTVAAQDHGLAHFRELGLDGSRFLQKTTGRGHGLKQIGLVRTGDAVAEEKSTCDEAGGGLGGQPIQTAG